MSLTFGRADAIRSGTPQSEPLSPPAHTFPWVSVAFDCRAPLRNGREYSQGADGGNICMGADIFESVPCLAGDSAVWLDAKPKAVERALKAMAAERVDSALAAAVSAADAPRQGQLPDPGTGPVHPGVAAGGSQPATRPSARPGRARVRQARMRRQRRNRPTRQDVAAELD
jgi:hypothetical protein